MAKVQDIATRKPSNVVAVPDYIQQGKGRGNEAIGTEDVVIPRIELVQALSPCLKPNDPHYIPGAKVGDLFNSLTRELYGPKLRVVPVYYKAQYLGWRDRKKGGGFCGAFDTLQECEKRIAEQPNREEWEAIRTGQHVVLVVKDDGQMEEAGVSMARTKEKISKQWNSLIRMKGEGQDRFAGAYTLFSTEEKNSLNQDYVNFAVSSSGYVTKDEYVRAANLYNSISGGRAVHIDSSVEGEGNENVTSKDY